MCLSDSPISSSCPAQLEAPHHHLAWAPQNGSSACSCKQNNFQLSINKKTYTCSEGDNFRTGSMDTHKGTNKKKKLNPLVFLYTALPAIHIGPSACRENYKKNLCAQSKVCVWCFYFLSLCYLILIVSRDDVGGS